MATEDCKELLSSGSEDVENDLYNDINNTPTSLTNEKNGEDFQFALEDDKEVEEANAGISAALVGGHETEDELGDNSAENDQRVEAIDSSSKKGTKKILRKRKKNVEDASAHTSSSPAKAVKKRVNDMSPIKIKEVPPFDESTQGNAKKEDKTDEKLDSIGKAEDEVQKTDGKDVKTGKKTETTTAKKKITRKAKGESSNAAATPTESPNVAAVEATSSLEENAKLDAESDEILASATPNSIPAIEGKDAEDKSTPSTTKKQVKRDDTALKQSNKVDGMGLIFMCNAKTKIDCFKYNVFGLPESKKALVAKIYKGMRLFLYDFDLKLLYGIYKATSPGGFNIEPKAFGSKFPSQVRFTVLSDFLPLPEEIFKAAIKENYTRNKFDCQLSSVQVRKLCKLFQKTTASGSIQKHRPGAFRELTIPSSRREPRRSHIRIETYPSPPPRVRHLSPLPRARYPSPSRPFPVQTHPRVLPPPPHLSYAYEQPGESYYYTRDRRVFDLEMRPRDLPVDYSDSYSLYRDPDPYREPVYALSLPPTYAVRLREPRSPPRYLY